MGLTILDVDDAMMGAQTKIDDFWKDYEEKFYEPQLIAQIGKDWNSVTPEQRQLIPPDKVKEMDRRYKYNG